MKPLTRLKNLTRTLNVHERRSLQSFLQTINPKFGERNKSIDLIDSMTKQDLDSNVSDALRKRSERLTNKIYTILSFDFNLNRKNAYSYYERAKINIHKDLLSAQIAISRNNDEDFEYFLKRSFKIALRIEQFDSMKYVLDKLILHYGYRRKPGLVRKYGGIRSQLLRQLSFYQKNDSFLSMNRAELISLKPEKFNSLKQYVIDQYYQGSSYKRIRRQQIYCFLLLQKELEISESIKLKQSYEAVMELISLLEKSQELFTSKELPIAYLNLNIIRLSSGSLENSCKGFKVNLDKLFHQAFYYEECFKYYYRSSIFTGFQDSTFAIEDHNSDDINYLKSVLKMIEGKPFIRSLARLKKLRLQLKEYDLFCEIYTALGFITKKEFDQADRLIFRIRRDSCSENEKVIMNIWNALESWAKKGFQGQIQDLPKEIINPLKEHYENTWNPLSADMIPLHLWHNPRGLPNHKEVYAHLFECKRKKTLEQGLFID